jgi:cellulose synthase/poly-beta-1,6-N-acetylglucosamine synthase-like glycosyltransferase
MPSQVPRIAVIIPSNHDQHELLIIVNAVCIQTIKPAEILIVDTSVDRDLIPKKIMELCSQSGIQLIYEKREHAFPGHARNICLRRTNSDWIAFIDVQTIARPNWLETSIDLIKKNGATGAFGATSFSAESIFERLVRDGFHGVLPRKTLPGSIFRRDVFCKVGQFIDWVRAGEDTEWMMRLELFKINIVQPPSALADYVGLIGIDLKTLLKKWYRNYMASRDLPQFFPHKLLLWLVLYPLLILIAFNWNFLIADWHMDSPFYIGHVTKSVALFPVLLYVILRGLVLPISRGVSIRSLLPIRFLGITLICFITDLMKVLVFSLPRRKNSTVDKLDDN